MMKFLLAGAALMPVAALAQSTVTLDSFSLDDLTDAPATQAAPESGPDSEMRDCLLDQSACSSAEFGGAASFTLDDVVNLGVVDRSTADGIAKTQPETTPLPSIDLEVLFAYNSDELTPQAMTKLSSLASALQDPRLKDSQLIFIGHTDATGSAAYNMDLSRRRAQAVAAYVQATMRLSPSRIEAVGVGFTKLKNNWDPAAAQNRRVQLVLVPGA